MINFKIVNYIFNGNIWKFVSLFVIFVWGYLVRLSHIEKIQVIYIKKQNIR